MQDALSSQRLIPKLQGQDQAICVCNPLMNGHVLEWKTNEWQGITMTSNKQDKMHDRLMPALGQHLEESRR